MFDHTTPKCRDLMAKNTRKFEYLPSSIKAFPAKELSKFQLNQEYSPADYRLTPMLEWRPIADYCNYEEALKKIKENVIELERKMQEMKKRRAKTGKYFSSDSSSSDSE